MRDTPDETGHGVDDLLGVLMVHMGSATVATIIRRKSDNTGWWIEGGGGLSDRVIANQGWRPLRVVLAEHAAMIEAGGLSAGATDVAPEASEPSPPPASSLTTPTAGPFS